MSDYETLLAEIDAYCAKRGWSPSTFGTHAVGDGKFHSRLSAGRRCWPETAEKARRFMAENPVSPTKGAAA